MKLTYRGRNESVRFKVKVRVRERREDEVPTFMVVWNPNEDRWMD
jgi:hypothetical protein